MNQAVEMSCFLKTFRLTVSVLFLVLAPPLSAENPASDTENENSSEIKGFSLEDLPEPEPGQVKPLDAWIPLDERPAPEPKPEPTPASEPEAPKPWLFLPDDELVSDDQLDSSENTKKGPVRKKQRSLSPRVQRQRLKIAKTQSEKLRTYFSLRRKDPRGRREVRICGVNLQGYRGFRGSRGGPIGRTVARKVSDQRCDVVALQGLQGRLQDQVDYTAEVLADAFYRYSKRKYVGYTGKVGILFGANAVFVNEDVVKVLDANPKHSQVLDTLEVFPRPPKVVQLKVQGRDGAPPKQLYVMSVNIEVPSVGEPLQAIRRAMEMAEVLRTYAVRLQRGFDIVNPPLFVMSVYRGAGRFSAPARIISGRERLVDVREGGRCSLDAEGNLDCAEGPGRPQIFFGLISDGIIKYSRLVKLDKWNRTSYYSVYPGPKERKKIYLSRLDNQEEVYMLDQDLKAAWQHGFSPGRFDSKIEKLRLGRRSTGFITVDLNW